MPKKVGDERRNFRFALLQGTFMRINLAFADSATVLPAFIHKLSGSDLLVGLTGSMMTAGWMWPQLLMSNLLEHRPRKMPFYALGMSVRVLAWLAVFFCTITIGERNPMLLAGSFLGFYFLSSSAMGVSTLPYMDIVSKSIAPQQRARFFSLRQLYGGFFAIWVGFLVRAVLGDESEFTGILGSITQIFKTFTMYFIGSVCRLETDLGFPYNYAFLFVCSVAAAFLLFREFLRCTRTDSPRSSKTSTDAATPKTRRILPTDGRKLPAFYFLPRLCTLLRNGISFLHALCTE